VQSVLEDWRTAPVTPALRATLAFLEKMTLAPEGLERADADAVRAAGVGEEALVDAIHIGALFNMIVRLADALDFAVPGWETFVAGAGARYERGYKLLTEPPV
jgi:alkylhydroperoxidase family enzyme